jgi:hypothetical protein
MHTETYNAMMKLAREQRRGTESDAQSFSRLAQSPEGHALMRKHQQEQLPDAYIHSARFGPGREVGTCCHGMECTGERCAAD